MPDLLPTSRPAPSAAAGALAAAAARWGLDTVAVEAVHIELREGHFLFTSDDPRVVFRFAAPRPAGWYALEAAIDSPVPLRPRAYLPDARGGFPVDQAVTLVRGADGGYAAFFRAPRGFSALRFDPSDMPVEAAIASLRLRRIGPAELAAAAVRAGRSALRRRGLAGLARFLRSALLTVLRPARFDSFDTVGGRRPPSSDPAERYRRWVALDERRSARLLADIAAGRVAVPPASFLIAVMADPSAAAAAGRLDGLAASLAAGAGAGWRALLPGPPGAATADPRIEWLPAAPADLAGLVALAAARPADWIVLLPDDARLAPHALAVLARHAAADPAADLIYADDDDLDPATAERRDGRFRPGWSEAHFEARDYLGPLIALRRAALPARAPASFTDLVLDLAARPGAIAHVAEVLVHRVRPPDAQPPPPREALAARRARLAARKPGIAYEVVAATGAIRARQPIPSPPPLVSIIVPTRDRVDLLAVAVGSVLDRTTYPHFEIVVVDNGSTDPATLAWFEAQTDPRLRILAYPLPFNYSAINNFAAARARGDILVLLNNDTEIRNPDWLDELVGWAARPDVGAVGAKLYFPSGTIQHGGVVLLSRRGVAGHLHLNEPGTAAGYMDRLHLTQDLSAVTAACLALRRSVFEAVGGLDERHLAVAFNDVDLCLRIRAAGWRVIWTPYAELTHYESVSRGSDMAPERKARFLAEVDHMAATWGATLEHDPFYSPHFERGNANFVLEVD